MIAPVREICARVRGTALPAQRGAHRPAAARRVVKASAITDREVKSQVRDARERLARRHTTTTSIVRRPRSPHNDAWWRARRRIPGPPQAVRGQLGCSTSALAWRTMEASARIVAGRTTAPALGTYGSADAAKPHPA